MRGVNPDRLRGIAETAKTLQVPIKQLFNWHLRGEGPPLDDVDGRLKYRDSDIEAWLRSRLCTTGEPDE